MTHTFNPTILREYDVRGIVGKTLTKEDAWALGRSFGSLAADEGARSIAVGRDGRTHSPELAQALVDGLMECGLHVIRIGVGPSPMLYYANNVLDMACGVPATGSHNPPPYHRFNTPKLET